MIKAEEEILIFKKAEEICSAFTKRLFQARLEYTSEHQKVLRDLLRDSLKVFSVEHKDNLAAIGDNFEDAKDHFNHQINMKFAQKIAIEGGDFVKSELTKHPVLPIYSQKKYAILLKL